MWGPSLPGPRGSWGSPQSGEGLWQGLCLEWRGPGNWKGQPKLWMQMRGAVPSLGSQEMGRAGHSCREREGGPKEGVVLGRGPRPRVGRAPPEPA